jgi:nitric oxide reductase subunit B
MATITEKPESEFSAEKPEFSDDFKLDYSSNMAGMLKEKKYWALYFLVVVAISVGGVGYFTGVAESEVPPLVDYVSETGEVIMSAPKIQHGEEIFHLRGLMSYGTFLGDGGERGPDYTAEALHIMAVSMNEFYIQELHDKGTPPTTRDLDAIKAQVITELHLNRFDAEKDVVVLNDAQIFAWENLRKYYIRVYTEPDFKEKGLTAVERFKNPDHADDLAAFYFWGGWLCAANRPNEPYSYTHNWPYDPLAGNEPTPEVMVWSIASVMVLFVGLMLTLYIYGQCPEDEPSTAQPLTTQDLEANIVRPTQRACYKFFVLSMLAFVIQTISGIACSLDYVRPMGMSACMILPFTVFRSWHTVFQIYWFFVMWVGATIFFLPRFSKVPPGQSFLIELLYYGCLVVAVGGVVGIPLGQMGLLEGSVAWYFGSQGWEYMELGRFFQDLLLMGFVLWIVILLRGVAPYLTIKTMWSAPAWLFYGSLVMVAFLFFSLKVTPKANFIVADFWRWMVVHMWVEVTFEVFTTVMVSFLLSEMGLVTRRMAERVTYIAVMLFFLTAAIGIGHNFYWIAKPTGVIALGSTFSTTQVIPLILLTLDAWKVMQERERAEMEQKKGRQKFVMKGVFQFLVGINFWNIFGAGVMGSIVNMPIINYFLHSTYITGAHAHGAMFGVKGNIALCGMLFCVQHLVKEECWSERIVKISFWCLNGGMAMMMFMDLFPTGLYQFYIVLKYGFWYARGDDILHGKVFQVLANARAPGGHVFIWGGLMPLTYLICSRWNMLKEETDPKTVGKEYISTWSLDELELKKKHAMKKTQ